MSKRAELVARAIQAYHISRKLIKGAPLTDDEEALLKEMAPVDIVSILIDELEIQRSEVFRLAELRKQDIESLQKSKKDLEYMRDINSNLHTALHEFYEKTKVNRWLKKAN